MNLVFVELGDGYDFAPTVKKRQSPNIPKTSAADADERRFFRNSFLRKSAESADAFALSGTMVAVRKDCEALAREALGLLLHRAAVEPHFCRFDIHDKKTMQMMVEESET